jgi:hypothetical protein
MLFMQSATYDLTEPDGGPARPSAFSFVEPAQKFSVALFVAIFSSL